MSTSTTPTDRAGYHHGDLRAALLGSAMGMLERGEPFSLRAVARGAGVSATAPYRHFADREALESALAVEGFRDLEADLTAAPRPHDTVEQMAEFGAAYVAFALRRPALFRLMLGECGNAQDVRFRAAADVLELLTARVAEAFPAADAATLASAGWALAHGLAFLHLDGKLPTGSLADAADQVRSAFRALLSAQQVSPREGAP